MITGQETTVRVRRILRAATRGRWIEQCTGGETTREGREIRPIHMCHTLVGREVKLPTSNCSTLVATTPVTQDLYERVTGKNPSAFKGPRHPVERVSWYAAARFCNLLSKAEGLEEMYTIRRPNAESGECEVTITRPGGLGFRLPTVAEWRYACGEPIEPACIVCGKPVGSATCNHNTPYDKGTWNFYNSSGETHPVGEKPPNRYGLHDMGGNVWEWCWDNAGETIRWDKWSMRVTCGGSFAKRETGRNAIRIELAWLCSQYVGFRVVRNYYPRREQ